MDKERAKKYKLAMNEIRRLSREKPKSADICSIWLEF